MFMLVYVYYSFVSLVIIGTFISVIRLTFVGIVLAIVGSPRGDLGELRGSSKVILAKKDNWLLNIFQTICCSIRVPSGSHLAPLRKS